MFFEKAKPIWAKNRERELNLTLKFSSKTLKQGNYTLKITASCLYRVTLDGAFLGYGPARCAHCYFRVDEYSFSGRNNSVIQIEVAGYNTKSFYTLNQPSFLQAEIIDESGNVVCFTDENADFTCTETERLSRVLRFSYQRPFGEYYSYKKPCKKQTISVVQSGQFLPRRVEYPNYTDRFARLVESGIFTENPLKAHMEINRINSTPTLKIYPIDQLERCPVPFINSLEYTPSATPKNAVTAGEYAVYQFDTCQAGFIGLDIKVKENAEIHLIFDEIDFQENSTQKGIHIDYTRNDCYNLVSYELSPNDHHLLTFEAYILGYVKVIVAKGAVEINSLSVKSYEHPFLDSYEYKNANKKVENVVMAAARSFAHNAVDALTDCASRERGAWLCDGLYAAKSERFFTGENKVERNFLENYALYSKIDNIPDGMLPMCYPADFEKEEFIPNWAMWYVLQLHDYFSRTGDSTLIHLSKKNVDGLLQYFARFENEFGLLEDLENWVFVEWSKSNDFTNGVNYPSNMLYAKMLDCVADLYGPSELKTKAQNIREIIKRQSFNGEFFEDNAVRVNGKLERTGNTTETCQYYAFYFGVATAREYQTLFNVLLNDFGPNRDEQTTYPKVYRSNAFMGNYLRLDILLKENLKEKVLSESLDFFYKMSTRTGTLWEHSSVTASLDHGFASYAAYLITTAYHK